jgi:hypothetical protein
MRGEKVVQARAECVAELTRAGAESLVLGPRQRRHLEGSIQPVFRDFGSAVGLGRAAKRMDVAVFDLREVALCLSVGEAEHRARVRRAVDVWNAITISVDRHRRAVAVAESVGVGA